MINWNFQREGEGWGGEGGGVNQKLLYGKGVRIFSGTMSLIDATSPTDTFILLLFFLCFVVPFTRLKTL